MNKERTGFAAAELAVLIDRLTGETERHQQERLVQRIGEMKSEQTAARVAELFAAEDVYLRGAAIEILAAVGTVALPVLTGTLRDKDRNIRKFSLDALKNIKARESCELALTALDDPDENVVEAAVEVVAAQRYGKAAGKLLAMFKSTGSIWILNAIIRALASMETRGVAGEVADRIVKLPATAFEKSILMNSLVKSLGVIGTYEDISKVLQQYAVEYRIDESNLVVGLSGLIVNNHIDDLTEKDILVIGGIFKQYRDYSDASLVLLLVAAQVKLQLAFFLEDIQAIVALHTGEEFFLDSLLDSIGQLAHISGADIDRMLHSGERELMLMGLRLIYKQHIGGFNSIVEELCGSADRELAELAISILSDAAGYRNVGLLENFTDLHEAAAQAAVAGVHDLEDKLADLLFANLEHGSRNVRRVACAKLIALAKDICVRPVCLARLEAIVRHNQGEEGLEALAAMMSLDRSRAMKYVTARMDSMDDKVRSGLTDMVADAEDSVFYDFMETMLNDPAAAVRKTTIKALSQRGGERSFQLLQRLFRDEPDRINKKEIISTLYNFTSPQALSMASNAARSSDILLRMAAVKALGLFGGQPATDILLAMLDDSVEEVREVVKEALGRAEGVS